MSRSGRRASGIRLVVCLAVFAPGCATLSDDPQSISDLYEDSLRAYAQKDYKLAAVGLAKVVERVPSDAEAWFRLGNAYSRTNRPRQAAAAYQQSVLKNPRHARAWYNLGLTQTRIAANSYLEMSRHLEDGDPLRDVALRMAEALLETLDGPARLNRPAGDGAAGTTSSESSAHAPSDVSDAERAGLLDRLRAAERSTDAPDGDPVGSAREAADGSRARP